MVDVHVLRVFTDEAGRHGNPLGVVLDVDGRDGRQRQALATRLGYSETVFVDDAPTARVRIFTPACELPFAGHPLVGVSWLLARETGRPPDVLRPALITTPVPTFVEDGVTWVRGSVADTPPWEHVQLASAAQVASEQPPAPDRPDDRWSRTQIWAWVDESAGIVRARVFARAYGVVEDEACGSATLRLAAQLGRPITARHGRGSLILARPSGTGQAEIGGHVAFAETRTVDDPV